MQEHRAEIQDYRRRVAAQVTAIEGEESEPHRRSSAHGFAVQDVAQDRCLLTKMSSFCLRFCENLSCAWSRGLGGEPSGFVDFSDGGMTVLTLAD
jgi:hypothetical protein